MLLFVVCQGCDLSGLLSFDPESIEPAHSTARDEPSPSVIADQLQRLKALLSSPIETLVENSEEVKNILEEIQPHVPVTLQLKLWPVGKDDDDKVEIAEVDHVRAGVLHALETFLQ
jgi:hypothetical protein